MQKFSQEVRERAVRVVLEHEGDHPSRWAAMVLIAQKVGCKAQTLNEWVKKTEVDAGIRAVQGLDQPLDLAAVEIGDVGQHV